MSNNLESLNSIVLELSNLIPQFSTFIDQFNGIVSTKDISVVTDISGNMSLDVPKDMSDDYANALSKRIGIIDRLINDRRDTINDLFKKGFELENKLRTENSNYTSQLSGKFINYGELARSYKH